MPEGLLKLLRSYLSDREVLFNWNGAQVKKELTKGCPQESILCPLLWNIMFETLLRQDAGERNEMIACADDLDIAVQGRTKVDLQFKAQFAMNAVAGWSSLSKMCFS